MQFNPTDKAVSLVADIDFLLFGDSATLNTDYSLTDRTRNINISWDEAIAELYKADPNYKWDDITNTDFPLATIALTSGLDHYTLLDSALIIHRIRVKQPNGEWKTLKPASRRELTDEELKATGTPEKYYKMSNAIFPVPVPNYGVAGGFEVEFQRGANYFIVTDTTKSPGFNAQFHPFLSVSAALRYAIAKGLPKKISTLSALKEQIKTAMREHYQTRSPDERPKLKIRRTNVGTGL